MSRSLVQLLVRVGALCGILLVVIVWSRNAGAVRIVGVWPRGDSEDAREVSLKFSRPVVPPAVVGHRVVPDPADMAPALDGEWRWRDRDRLVFVLAEPLPEGRRFRVRVGAELEATIGVPLSGPREFTVETAGLRLLEVKPREFAIDGFTLTLLFSGEVAPAALAAAVSVLGHSGPVVTSVRGDVPARRLDVRCGRALGERGFRLRLERSLCAVGAERGLAQTVTRWVQLPEDFLLNGAEGYRRSLGQPGRVSVRFTRDVDPHQDLSGVAVEPELPDLVAIPSWRGIDLRGSFEPGQRYTITFPAGLRSRSGCALLGERRVSVTAGDYSPSLAFPFRRGVLSPGGRRALALRAAGISTVEFAAWRVHENNLAAHLHHDRPRETSRALARKRVDVPDARRAPHEVVLDLVELLGDAPGVYELDASSPGTWARARALLCITDLGVSCRLGRTQALVWTTSIRDGTPLAGVEVELRSFNNQRLTHGRTGVDGTVELPVSRVGDDGTPWLVVARKGDDLAYLLPGQRVQVIDETPQDGRAIPDPYEAMVYAERGIYRPGATCHLTAVVRDANGAVPPSFPLEVRVHRPDGRVVHTETHEPGPQGVLHLDHATATHGSRGRYRVDVRVPGERWAIGETSFLLEDFVPPRLKVDVRAPVAVADGEDELRLETEARYSFGPPAAGLSVRVSGRFREEAFHSAACPGYTFTPDRPLVSVEAVEVELTADGDGRAAATVAPRDRLAPGWWVATLSATVTEPGARSVSATTRAVRDTRHRYLGLRAPARRGVAPVATPFTVEWVRRTGSDEPAPADRFEMRLARVFSSWNCVEVNGRRRWQRFERETEIERREVTAAGAAAGRFEILCPGRGNYRLRVCDLTEDAPRGDGARGAVTVLELAAFAPGDLPASTLHPDRLQLSWQGTAQVPTAPGELAVHTPFAGTLLLTLETAGVLERRVVPLDGREAHIPWTLPAGLRGSAYFAGTLVRAIDPGETTWQAHHALGLARVIIDPRAQVLPLAVEGPEVASPGERVHLRVHSAPPADPARPALMHLWAVDEGILRTTGYATPDPARFFLAPRRPGVSGSDTLADLLPDTRAPSDLTYIGGDADVEGAAALRRGPMPARRRAAAVVWRRAAPLDGDGTLDVELDLPDATGELRIMAVAVDGDLYGSTARALRLSAPLVVESSWPRCAAPGDRFRAPVKIFNSTDAPLDVAVRVTAEGPLWVAPAGRAAGAELEAGDGWLAGVGDGAHAGAAWRPAAASADEAGAAAAATGGGIARAVFAPPLFDAPAPSAVASVTVPAQGSALVWWQAQVTGTGPVEVRACAEGVDPTGAATSTMAATDRASLVARRATPVTREASFLRVAAGDTALSAPGHRYLPGAARTRLRVSARPDIDLIPALERLARYPYGCVEQTSSRMLVMLFADDIAERDGGRGSREGRGRREARARSAGSLWLAGDQKVARAIARLRSMQTPSGGLSYWPGGAPHLWGTAHAAHCLIQARRAGHDVPERFTDEIARYLGRQLVERGPKDLGPCLEVFICRVLGDLGRPQESRVTRLTERIAELDAGGRAHLACAWLALGRRDRAREVLPTELIGLTGREESDVPASSGRRITSATRQQALLLDAGLDVDPGAAWLDELAARLERRRKEGAWGNTLENSSAIRALSRYRLTAGDDGAEFRGTVRAAGAVFSFDSTHPLDIALPGAPDLFVESAGTGTVHVVHTVEGQRADGADLSPVELGLAVERRWLDSRGQPVEPGRAFGVGELVQVEVTLRSTRASRGRDCRNIAIVDALPGGFEVENPRLDTSIVVGRSEAALPDRVEFLADRVVLFASAHAKPQTFRYALRATTAGTYEVPGIEASSMYDPALCARGALSSVTVLE